MCNLCSLNKNKESVAKMFNVGHNRTVDIRSSAFCEPDGDVKSATCNWFALKGDDSRPLFAFAGIWRRHRGPVKKDGKLAYLMKARSWERGSFVEKGGWATMPGSAPNTGEARACADFLAGSGSSGNYERGIRRCRESSAWWRWSDARVVGFLVVRLLPSSVDPPQFICHLMNGHAKDGAEKKASCK